MSLSLQRIDIRVNEQVKLLAERAAHTLGCTVTEYLVRLIQEDAPKVLRGETQIVLANAPFDRFVAFCQHSKAPSPRLLKAAKQLDNEGF